MDFIPVKTRKFLPPKDDLFGLLDQSLPALKEKDLVLITSKLVSIHQGRCVKITPDMTLKDKIRLIKKEADGWLPQTPHGLAVKDLTLTPYAGVDRSNGKNHYILLPQKPHLFAKKIWTHLRNKYRLKNLGVVVTDSFCLPLRWGHMGISVGFWGFHPNYSYVGQPDIFGRKIVEANSNLVDALAAFGGVIMGEGNEQTPLLIVRGLDKIRFTSKPTLSELKIPQGKSDLYAPLLKVFKKTLNSSP